MKLGGKVKKNFEKGKLASHLCTKHNRMDSCKLTSFNSNTCSRKRIIYIYREHNICTVIIHLYFIQHKEKAECHLATNNNDISVNVLVISFHAINVATTYFQFVIIPKTKFYHKYAFAMYTVFNTYHIEDSYFFIIFIISTVIYIIIAITKIYYFSVP